MKVSAPDRAGAPRFLEAARSSDWIPLWPSHPEPVRFRNNGLLRAVCFLQVGWAWTPPHPCPALMAPPDFLSLPHIDCACGWQCLAPKSFPQGHQVTAPLWVTQQGQPGTRERMHGQVCGPGFLVPEGPGCHPVGSSQASQKRRQDTQLEVGCMEDKHTRAPRGGEQWSFLPPPPPLAFSLVSPESETTELSGLAMAPA